MFLQHSSFEQTNAAALAALMKAHPLATLVHHAGGALQADLIPLQWRPAAGGQTGTLVGHVSRANPLWQAADGQPVLAVFQGPQAYVTPSWYPSKGATAKVVPTWNYTLVHARGTLRTIEDPAWLHDLLQTLTDEHEAGRAHPWRLTDAPADYIEKMLRAVVGIEIAVDRLEGKWKTSQNRPLPDRLGVHAGLLGEPGDEARALAALVKPADDASAT